MHYGVAPKKLSRAVQALIIPCRSVMGHLPTPRQLLHGEDRGL